MTAPGARIRLTLAIAALSALPVLSGCVAAVLPVMAAGTVVGVDKSKDKRRADAAERQGRVRSVDVALFGRMLAQVPGMNIEAASQVAHAISTHALDQDFDFTAGSFLAK